MKYVSTRGAAGAPAVGFAQAALAGLAPDGGLYVPESWPQIDEATFEKWRALGYRALAYEVMRLFTAPDLDGAALRGLIDRAYAPFDVDQVVRLRPLDDRRQVLELFHGPTLAFKDVALQFLGQLFSHLLPPGERAMVVGATSGDTGSAAIAACAGLPNLDVVILFPDHGPSEIQRRQMTTTGAANVHALAIAGSFDDCQNLVKKTLASPPPSAGPPPGRRWLAVNSINWARILAQIVYYIYAALQAGGPDRSPSFVVPTGNFGNIYAGYAARMMGLPIAKLAAATNRNDAVARFFASGKIAPQPVAVTCSPSMDILIPSNLERLLFALCGRDAAATQAALNAPGGTAITARQLGEARQFFTAATVDDATALAELRAVKEQSGFVADPHTAVGLAAAEKLAHELPDPVICLATAAAEKFPETMEKALGTALPESPKLRELRQKPEKKINFAADFAALTHYIHSIV